VFRQIVLDNSVYLDMILSDVFTLPTYSMGLVDEQNRVNFYDGMVRVVDPEGREFIKVTIQVPSPHLRRLWRQRRSRWGRGEAEQLPRFYPHRVYCPDD